jgi:hypothetical protein
MTAASTKPVSDHRGGPDAAAILATEHWSLLGSRSLLVAAGTAAFLVVWTALFLLEGHTLDPLRRTTPRFPTPPTKPESTADRRDAKEEG